MTALQGTGGSAASAGVLFYGARQFKDFELSVDYRAAATNSNGGVLLRFPRPARDGRRRPQRLPGRGAGQRLRHDPLRLAAAGAAGAVVRGRERAAREADAGVEHAAHHRRALAHHRARQRHRRHAVRQRHPQRPGRLHRARERGGRRHLPARARARTGAGHGGSDDHDHEPVRGPARAAGGDGAVELRVRRRGRARQLHRDAGRRAVRRPAIRCRPARSGRTR